MYFRYIIVVYSLSIKLESIILEETIQLQKKL